MHSPDIEQMADSILNAHKQSPTSHFCRVCGVPLPCDPRQLAAYIKSYILMVWDEPVEYVPTEAGWLA